jgi:phosphosulfolactate synthase
MNAFEFMDVLKRAEKPRENGLTMVLDKGLGYNAVQDLMEVADYIDIIKLGWGIPMLYPENTIRRKIKRYKENDIWVSNGGTIFEIAYSQRRTDAFLRYAKEIGMDSIEISDGSIDISREERTRIIEEAKDEFKVFTEVGKKEPEKDAVLSIEKRIEEAKMDLEAGASYVIMEARESGRGIGIYDEVGRVKEGMTKALVEGIGLQNIIFETPEKSQQVYLILNLSSNVNLGNIKPDDVIPLETLRRGLRGDTLGKL